MLLIMMTACSSQMTTSSSRMEAFRTATLSFDYPLGWTVKQSTVSIGEASVVVTKVTGSRDSWVVFYDAPAAARASNEDFARMLDGLRGRWLREDFAAWGPFKPVLTTDPQGEVIESIGGQQYEGVAQNWRIVWMPGIAKVYRSENYTLRRDDGVTFIWLQRPTNATESTVERQRALLASVAFVRH